MSKKNLIDMLEGKIDLSKVISNGGAEAPYCRKPKGYVDLTEGIKMVALAAVAECYGSGALYDAYKVL